MFLKNCLVLVLLVLFSSKSSGQFNNHDFLKHPGLTINQSPQGVQFTQRITHQNGFNQPAQNQFQSPPFGSQRNSNPFGSNSWSPTAQQPPQPSSAQSQSSSMNSLITQAFMSLSPDQIASILRSHPAVQQMLSQPTGSSSSFGPPPQQQQFQPPAQFQQPPPQRFQSFQPQQQQAPPPQQSSPPSFNSPQPQPSQQQPSPNGAAVHFANIGQQPQGDYQFGYHTGGSGSQDPNSFREEVRLPDGTVKGAYGYVDANGKQRIVRYTAGKEGFKAEGDILPELPPGHQAPAAPNPGPQVPSPSASSQREQQVAAPQQQQQQQQSQVPQQNFQFGNPGSALASFLNIQNNGRNF